jgi:hypothetical protein
MNNARITVQAGVCGFVSDITAASDDGQMVQFTIASPCANIQGLAAKLPSEVDAYAEIGAGFDGELWTVMRGSLRGCCSGCVVPPSIFKAMQVAAGVALPADSSLHFHEEQA